MAINSKLREVVCSIVVAMPPHTCSRLRFVVIYFEPTDASWHFCVVCLNRCDKLCRWVGKTEKTPDNFCVWDPVTLDGVTIV